MSHVHFLKFSQLLLLRWLYLFLQFVFALFIVLMVSLSKQHELLFDCALLAVQCFLSSSLCDADFRSALTLTDWIYSSPTVLALTANRQNSRWTNYYAQFGNELRSLPYPFCGTNFCGSKAQSCGLIWICTSLVLLWKPTVLQKVLSEELVGKPYTWLPFPFYMLFDERTDGINLHYSLLKAILND